MIGALANELVFTDTGHLTPAWQVFLGSQTALRGIQAAPFKQTMYANGVMAEPWTTFFETVSDSLGLAQFPQVVNFVDANNKVSREWLLWLNQW